MDKLSEVARRLASLNKWLENCPFEMDGVYESAGTELDAFHDQALILAEARGDGALLQMVKLAVEDGEYGEHFDGNAPGFWEEVARMAEQVGE